MKQDDVVACRALAERYVSTRNGGRIPAKALGDGGSAVVFLWEQAERVVALKVYDPKFFLNEEAARAERHRLDLQRRLIGQHCPSMIDTIAVDEEYGTCFVVMEYFGGVELKKVIGKVPDDAVPALIRQLVDAVIFLERANLVHRDIKPENILVSEDFSELRLLDLGVVREISEDEDRVDGTDHGDKRPFIATAQYSSPEYLFRLEPPSQALWRALTIYQVGGVLHDLVCKKPLFERAVAADNKYALAMDVMREPPDFTGASPSLSNWAALAARCLAKDGALRLQTVDWSEFIQHHEAPRDRLKRALAVRAETANRSEANETHVLDLKRCRKECLSALADAINRRLIADFSPQLRVAAPGCNEVRCCLFLRLTKLELGVKLALELSWGSGLRERFGTLRVAAQAGTEQEWADFSGERKIVAEVCLDDGIQQALLDTVINAVSEILIKHAEIAETAGIAEGTDLIPITWQAKI